jgi:methylmalonyl-CoA/ethylmalonyl-CoA epimerase
MLAWNQLLEAQLLGVDHFAIAVRDLGESVALYTDCLGYQLVDQRVTRGERTGMVSAVLRLGPVTTVLVQGTEPESQVSRFIERFGPGVQHLALGIRDLDVAIEILSEHGIVFDTSIIESPTTRQIFTRRDPRIGVRIELIERRGEGFASDSVERLFRTLEALEAV